MVTKSIRDLLRAVVDPEIPALTIEDLGILRGIEETPDGVVVSITPTYSGCPAMDTIVEGIVAVLGLAGHRAEVRSVLAPPWTPLFITEEGRRKLAAASIAPPGGQPRCPRCADPNPRLVSEFGSTACKALMVCTSCGEPFDRFKDLP